MDLMTANRLQQLRKENGYTQEVLAEKLGISRQSVSKWERAEASPDTDNLIALSKIYGISVDLLLDTSADTVKINSAPKKDKDIKGKMKSIISKANDFGMYPETAKNMIKFPFPLTVTAVYVIVSMIFGCWHPFWLVFMLIPIYYRSAIACKAPNKKIFCLLLPIPEIIVTVFLALGFMFDNWHIIWVMYLIIPVYYWTVLASKNK